ncbi:diketogulonate reductase-like aldo/keto reductase [Tahibacter aquaticus]|uniref:Diketogulonate reductase-like aldo/keto reductase n=1 Tax=Tahibacter aquaticus TaxID=520092 RepID=A0A4R6Z4A9_9GAMM|nr:aldo/keto reductase [Tahibacter aquaticus]TDR46490.1 diketogulonate reductase-like aldo/keto reductase [Tahibacter aquaticus]
MSETRHRLLANGRRMPRLLYGTAWKKAQTARWVEAALRHGFDGIDTACQPKHYDEAGVGAGIAAAALPRETLYLQSKFTPLSGQDPARIPYDATADIAQQIRQSFAVSQRNLGTTYLDALLLHSPLRDRSAMRHAWATLESLVDEGGVGLIGISNCYDPDELQRLWRDARIKPSIVQNRFYADTGHDREIRAFCRANGVVYQSFWTLSANPQLLRSQAVLDLAAAHARTPAQILFRYLIQHDVVPLTGTTSLTHLRESQAIFDFALSEADCARVTALL